MGNTSPPPPGSTDIKSNTTKPPSSKKLKKNKSPIGPPVVPAIVAQPPKPKPIEFPVEGVDRKACMRKYIAQVGVKLGEGKHGAIVPACKDTNCKYVLKISDEIEDAQKEVFFLKLLQNEKLNGEPMVPMLFDNWLCSYPIQLGTMHSFIVVDRWDSDMYALGALRMSQTKSSSLVFTKSEIKRMFCLAFLLGVFGIIHGDLKLDQYLQRNDGKLIVITDFGFSGGKGTPYKAELGWSGHEDGDLAPKEYSCGTWFQTFESTDEQFPIFMNLIQIEMSIILAHAVVYLGNGKFARFGGIKDFNRNYADKYCSKWSTFLNQYNQKINDPFYLYMDDIIQCGAV